MSIDPGIYNLVGNGVKSVNDYDAQAQNLIGQRQKNAVGALDLQTTQQGVDDASALRAATRQFGTDPTANYSLLTQAGLAKPAADYLKSALDARKTSADTTLATSHAANFDADAQNKALDTKVKATDFHLQQLAGLTDPSQIPAWVAQGVQDGVMGMKESFAGQQQFLDYAAKNGFQAAKDMAMRGGVSALENLKMTQAKAIADQTNQTSLTNNATTNQTHLTGIGIQQSGENARTGANIAKDYAVAGIGADGQPTSDTKAMVDAIGQYKVQPPNGMALRNPRMQAILAQVTQQYPDFDATQYGARQVAAKAFSTGKDGQAVQSANTALNHLDTIEQLAKAQQNGNIPLFNQIANAYATQTGQPAPTNLKAAISMVAPELTKAVVGTGGGVGERADFAHNLNPNGSPAQIIGGVGTIKDLMGGRLTEAARTYKRTTGRDDFSDTFLSPAAQAVFAARSGATTTHPADITDLLQKYGK